MNSPIKPFARRAGSALLGLMLLSPLCALFGGSALAQGMISAQIERGRYLAKAGDCAACHTVKDGQSYAGGFPLATPFGTIYSTNITPDSDTGIGKWSSDDFYNTMHFGVRRDGKSLYPAMPFPWYTKLSRADVDAIKAYLDTLPPVRQENRRNELLWPLNWRVSASAWKTLFFHPGAYRPDPQKSAAWNRGAYLIEGAGHCAACHTDKNLFGATRIDRDLLGGDAGDSWFAPGLSRDLRDGIGGWSAQETVAYLKTGANSRAAAAGPMVDVVMDSTQYLSDGDLNAMAVYLQDLPHAAHAKSDDKNAGAAPAPAIEQASLDRGRALYVDNCAACHMAGGNGQPHAFPTLKGNPSLQSAKADSVIRIILGGARMADPRTSATGLTMPAYGWKFSDPEVADLANYIRNTWGNRAAAVTSGAVAAVRRDVHKGGAGDKDAMNSPY